jgi:hypothetical protein
MKIPTYIKQENQENYNEELNQNLNDNFSDNGWTGPPSLTTAQIMQLVTGPPILPVPTFWYNSTLDKLQFLGSGGLVQTITSV